MKLKAILNEVLGRAGRCFELAAKQAIKGGGIYTIAEVTSDGKTFQHAYVDYGNKIYDPEHDKYFDSKKYNAQLHPKVLKTLSSEQVSIFILKNKSFPYPENFNL
jgi:hypothetical protein